MPRRDWRPRDLPALARATHPAARHDWTGHPNVNRVLAALPTSRRGLWAWEVAHRAGISETVCRDVLAWLVSTGRVWTRGGYDHWPYEYLRAVGAAEEVAAEEEESDDTQQPLFE